MVDTGVVGHLDSAVYLGAVAIATTIFGFIYIGMNFLRMGTTGISAQRFGARDNDGIRTALGQALLVAMFIAVTLIALQGPIAHVAMSLLGATGDLEVYAREYFSIRIWSAPATLAGYVLVGWFIGMQNARIPLLIVVTVNVVNILLDLLFVLVLDMKVAGVALASLIAEYTGAALGLFFAGRLLIKHPGQWAAHKLVQLKEYAAFFSVNLNLLIRTLALVFTISFVTAQGARMGGLVLAANAILMQFQNLTAFGLDGVAHAAEALVGKAVGEKRREALERAVSLSLKWSLVFAGGFSFLYLVGGPLLVRILTDLPDVRETTLVYLPWMIASPLISVWSFLYDGVFVGAPRAKEMRNIMLISAFVVFLPAWYLLQPFGNHGLWGAFMLFLLARGVGMHVGYRRVVLPAA